MVRALGAVLALAVVSRLGAHEIPSDVTVHAFLKPEGRRLHLLVRAPLGAMRDIAYPRRGSGSLDLARAGDSLRDASNLWIADQVEIYEGDARLARPRLVAVRVSQPSEGSFETYEEAMAHVQGAPLPSDTELRWDQGMLDVLLEYSIQSEASRFSIRPGLARLGMRVVVALRFVTPAGAVRAFELRGDGDPELVRLDPRWHEAALRFVAAGFFHILDGFDHLLFLLCLVIPFRRFRALVLIVTSFTVAHSITLIASAFDVAPDALWFPPLIEALIAISIVYMALENIVAPRLQRRWMIAFGFGLVHGFGFSFALRETLQFAGAHLLTSLLSFNVGVELGQLLVLLLLVPVLELLFRCVPSERPLAILLSALVAHTGWHWMIERGDRLRRFQLEWPVFDATLLAGLLRWLTLGVAAAALAWLVFGVFLRSLRAAEEAPRAGR